MVCYCKLCNLFSMRKHLKLDTVNQKGNDLDKSNDFKCYQTMVNHLLLCLYR